MATPAFSCIDGHTCGNPVRLVSGGGPRRHQPSIAGWARMTGYNTIFIDDQAPFAYGFVVT